MSPDLKDLESIVSNTINAIESSKTQIAEIAHNAVTEVERVRKELEAVRQETDTVIAAVDAADQRYRKARLHLMEVSKDFHRFTEEDIKKAYQEAQEAQVAVARLGEREKALRFRRDDLERSVKRLYATQHKAESLVSQVAVVLNYLGSDLESISGQLDELLQSEKVRFHIIEIMEEERRRIAREIHDGPAQSMANLAMRTDLCLKLLEREPQSLGEELLILRSLIRDSMTEIRRIMFNLRPMILDDLGLIPALKKYFEQLDDRHKFKIEFTCLGSEQRLSQPLEVALFRVVQEALSNVQRHAGTDWARVLIEFLPEHINLTIKDLGKGFNTQEIMEASANEHYGLKGIQERVRLLQGDVQFVSSPGKGTSIVVYLPYVAREGTIGE